MTRARRPCRAPATSAASSRWPRAAGLVRVSMLRRMSPGVPRRAQCRALGRLLHCLCGWNWEMLDAQPPHALEVAGRSQAPDGCTVLWRTSCRLLWRHQHHSLLSNIIETLHVCTAAVQCIAADLLARCSRRA
jgi:hypothetical protein